MYEVSTIPPILGTDFYFMKVIWIVIIILKIRKYQNP
jgi:hypothetical protein